MVTPGSSLADVGCDHGYLPIWLVLNGRITSAVAMDVRPGPLERARSHIREQGLSDRIGTRLSDGLKELSPGECDSLVIAGMGGPLMERILEDGRELLPMFREMILQPQSDIPHFRAWLVKNGFSITDEEMIAEDGKYYTVIKAGPAEEAEDLSEKDLLFGPVLIKKRSSVLYDYLIWRSGILNAITENLKGSKNERSEERRAVVQREQKLINEVLTAWDQ